MNAAEKKIENFLNALNSADAIKVDGGPILSSFDVLDDNEDLILFSWHDDEGLRFEQVTTRSNITNSWIEKHKILFEEDGQLTTIELFTMQPIVPDEI